MTAVPPSSAPRPDRRHGTPPTGLDRGRSSGLDGLRAFAAVLVVAFHLHTVSGVSFGPLDPVIRGGDSGVYLFFALSGYLLYAPFVRGGVDLGAYGVKRTARILPGYFVALVGLTVLTGSRLPLEQPIPYLTMSSSYILPLRDFLGNAWTLSAEVLFYLSLPLLARVSRSREVSVLLALGATSAALAILLRVNITPENAWLSPTYPLVFYAFVPGMLLAVAQARRPAAIERLGRWPSLVAGSVLLVLGALTSIFPVALLTGVGTVLVMAWLLQHRLPGARLLTFLGGASYALYLWHKDASIAFGAELGLVVTVVAAALSWAVVERPILARAHAIAARRRVLRADLGAQPVPVPTP